MAVALRSSAMSPSGDVMMRLVKPAPAAVNRFFVIPAPKISSVGVVVVTPPLLASVLVPEAERLTSNGVLASRPRYSRILMSANFTATLNVTVTLFAPGDAARDVLRVVDGLTQTGPSRRGRCHLIRVPRAVGHRGDVGGGVVPSDRDDVGVAGGLSCDVRDADGALIGLWGRAVDLDERRRRGA